MHPFGKLLVFFNIRYEYINDVILDHLDDEIKSTDRSGVWRYLISFKVISMHRNNTKNHFTPIISSSQNLLRAIENIGIVSVYGIRYLSTGNVTQQNFIKWEMKGEVIISECFYNVGMWNMTPSSGSNSTPPSIWYTTRVIQLIIIFFRRPHTLRKSSRRFTKAMPTSIFTLYLTNTKLYFFRFYRMSDRQILNNAMDIEKGSSDIGKAMRQVSTFLDIFLFLFLQVFQCHHRVHAAASKCLGGAQRWYWVNKLHHAPCSILQRQGCGTGGAERGRCRKDHWNCYPLLHKVNEKKKYMFKLFLFSLITLLFYFFVKNALSVIRVCI